MATSDAVASPAAPAAAPDRASWEVFYHSGFLGRAEPAVYMLEASGSPYSIVPRDNCNDPTVFACPAFRKAKAGKVISQTVAVSRWIGRECGFAPPTDMDPDVDLKLALDLADVWSDMYAARKRFKDVDSQSGYVDGRLAKWMAVLEAQCTGPFFNGASPTYHDFLMVSNENMLEFCFGRLAFQRVMDRHPKLAALYSACHALPGVKALRDKVAAGWVQGQPIWHGCKALPEAN